MVLLTVTPSIVEASEKLQSLKDNISESNHSQDGNEKMETTIGTQNLTPDGRTKIAQQENRQGSTDTPQCVDGDMKSGRPILSSPKIGDPISHGQIIDIGRDMKTLGLYPQSLEVLLKGSKVYIAPLPQKPEPVGLRTTRSNY